MKIAIYMLDRKGVGEQWYLNTAPVLSFITSGGFMPRVDCELHDDIVRTDNMTVRAIEDHRPEIIEWLINHGISYTAPILNNRVNNIRADIEDEKLAAQFLLTFG